MLQAHAVQVQTLQNEFESLKAQLANLKGKSSRPTNHAQHVQGSGSREGPPRSFYGLSHDAMVGEYVISSAHNFSLTPKFTTSFALPILRHKRLVLPLLDCWHECNHAFLWCMDYFPKAPKLGLLPDDTWE